MEGEESVGAAVGVDILLEALLKTTSEFTSTHLMSIRFRINFTHTHFTPICKNLHHIYNEYSDYPARMAVAEEDTNDGVGAGVEDTTEESLRWLKSICYTPISEYFSHLTEASTDEPADVDEAGVEVEGLAIAQFLVNACN